jgi:hypothetical protein
MIAPYLLKTNLSVLLGGSGRLVACVTAEMSELDSGSSVSFMLGRLSAHLFYSVVSLT